MLNPEDNRIIALANDWGWSSGNFTAGCFFGEQNIL